MAGHVLPKNGTRFLAYAVSLFRDGTCPVCVPFPGVTASQPIGCQQVKMCENRMVEMWQNRRQPCESCRHDHRPAQMCRRLTSSDLYARVVTCHNLRSRRIRSPELSSKSENQRFFCRPRSLRYSRR
ncbi:hypothetical protein LF1_14740 [Rubripirellula obstinata]|uniref:Uncharacterized protein n=1 Tax=Rubripirellula obstinata TaxID=406547 RepID=A0A5B1CHA2_9BACT|nr:hypothetical protein LF1_14740 [Rubripirellula obstinata]